MLSVYFPTSTGREHDSHPRQPTMGIHVAAASGFKLQAPSSHHSWPRKGGGGVARARWTLPKAERVRSKKRRQPSCRRQMQRISGVADRLQACWGWPCAGAAVEDKGHAARQWNPSNKRLRLAMAMSNVEPGPSCGSASNDLH